MDYTIIVDHYDWRGNHCPSVADNSRGAGLVDEETNTLDVRWERGDWSYDRHHTGFCESVQNEVLHDNTRLLSVVEACVSPNRWRKVACKHAKHRSVAVAIIALQLGVRAQLHNAVRPNRCTCAEASREDVLAAFARLANMLTCRERERADGRGKVVFARCRKKYLCECAGLGAARQWR